MATAACGQTVNMYGHPLKDNGFYDCSTMEYFHEVDRAVRCLYGPEDCYHHCDGREHPASPVPQAPRPDGWF